jgi:hypothetical protein
VYVVTQHLGGEPPELPAGDLPQVTEKVRGTTDMRIPLDRIIWLAPYWCRFGKPGGYMERERVKTRSQGA